MSGVSCGDLMTYATDFDSALDTLMGTLSGYRRLAVDEIDAAQDQSDIDDAYVTLATSVQTFLTNTSFDSSL